MPSKKRKLADAELPLIFQYLYTDVLRLVVSHLDNDSSRGILRFVCKPFAELIPPTKIKAYEIAHSLDLMKWAKKTYKYKPSIHIMGAYAFNGNIKGLEKSKARFKHKYPPVLNQAIDAGQYDAFMWLYDRGYLIDENVRVRCILMGNFDAWFQFQRKCIFPKEIVRRAPEETYIAMYDALCRKLAPTHSSMFGYAIVGHAAFIGSSKMCDHLISTHIDFNPNRDSILRDDDPCRSALEYNVLAMASVSGNLGLLISLYKMGYEWHWFATAFAKTLEVLQWAIENGCPYRPKTPETAYIYANQTQDMYEWLASRGLEH